MSCVFNQEWLNETINSQFSSWVKPLKDPSKVLCCFCQQSFALSNMDKRALESHMNSDKHKRNVSAKVPSISLCFKKPTALSNTSIPNFVEKLCLGSTKLAYLITHGLAPFFHDELLKLIPSKYVICFDEAFNEISKKGQMDVVIRFWDSSMNKVCSRYLPSLFMGHSTAENIMNNFLEASSEMKLCNLIQVSMDGPNVNWSFVEQLSSDLHDEYGTTMLFLGSCGVHVINGSLTMVTKQQIGRFRFN